MLLPADLVQQVRRLQWKARRIARAGLAGEYHSAFKGSGLLFEDVREYEPGDDIRRIDWNVTARIGSPFVKRFVEERELTVLLVVDWSASMRVGTGPTAKRTVAAELAALLTLTAASNNDRVGLLGVTGEIERNITPNKGPRHTLRILRELLFHQPKHSETNLALAIQKILKTQKKRAVVFIVSDFLGMEASDALNQLGRKHDATALVIQDPLQLKLPELGLVRFQDAENGGQILVDTSNPKVKQKLQESHTQRQAKQKQVFNRAGVEMVPIDTHGNHINALVSSFRKRSQR